MDDTKSRLCRKTARNPSERFRKSSLNLLGTRVLMRGVSGCEDTCTVGDTCLERAFHALHFWESWLSVHLDLGGKRVYTREIHQPIIVLKSQFTIAAPRIRFSHLMAKGLVCLLVPFGILQCRMEGLNR